MKDSALSSHKNSAGWVTNFFLELRDPQAAKLGDFGFKVTPFSDWL